MIFAGTVYLLAVSIPFEKLPCVANPALYAIAEGFLYSVTDKNFMTSVLRWKIFLVGQHSTVPWNNRVLRVELLHPSDLSFLRTSMITLCVKQVLTLSIKYSLGGNLPRNKGKIREEVSNSFKIYSNKNNEKLFVFFRFLN